MLMGSITSPGSGQWYPVWASYSGERRACPGEKPAEVRGRAANARQPIGGEHTTVRGVGAVDCRPRQGYNVSSMETRANLWGGEGDALTAPVGECPRGRRARWAGGRDGSGGGRTVYSPARRPRGGLEVDADTAFRWCYRLLDPAQRARWRPQRHQVSLGRVRNRLRCSP